MHKEMTKNVFEEEIKERYSKNDNIRNLIIAECFKNSCANVILYEKNREKEWHEVLRTEGFVGKNGIGKDVEGDKKTPKGVFSMTQAFGIKKNPGTKIPYIQVKEKHYWCTDDAYYNRFIDINQHPHECKGEHLIEYKGLYNYGLAIDYNKECIKGKGSAIFLHCQGDRSYTDGCIAIPESKMKAILRKIQAETKICIYQKPDNL